MKKPKYRSKFEARVAALLPRGFAHEPKRFRFEQTRVRTYLPDFVDEKNKIVVESKGRLRSFDEAIKSVLGAKAVAAAGYKVLFVLYDPSVKAYPQCKKRADGTRLSIAEYLNAYNVAWCTADTLKAALRRLAK